MENTASGNAAYMSGNSHNADGTLGNISSGAHAAVNSIAGAADDVARNAKPAIDRVAAMAHQAVDKAAGAAVPTADWLSAQGASINQAQKKMVDGTCSYVAANPLKSVGFALVAGFLLSRVILK